MYRKWSGVPIAAALAVGLLYGPARADANILVNGSFESGLSNWTTAGFIAQGYDYGVDDLSQTGNAAFYGGGIGGLAYLRQTLTTVVGQQYLVDLWALSDGYLPNQLQLGIGGQPVFALDDALISNGYLNYRAGFVATGTLTPLQFGLRNDSGFFHLDGISVTPVPEPAAWLLMAAGLCALLTAGLRRAG